MRETVHRSFPCDRKDFDVPVPSSLGGMDEQVVADASVDPLGHNQNVLN